MNCEVAVVGGGIGGLTVAALLAQRGVNVCLFERESEVGGCVTTFEKLGYSFEPADGLYTGWKPHGVHARIFAELPVEPPESRLLQPSYIVALPDGSRLPISANRPEFEGELARVFPECSQQAIGFYREVSSIGGALKNVFASRPALRMSSGLRRVVTLASQGASGLQILKSAADTAGKHLEGLSPRFRRFIDVQLQTLAQGDSSQISYLFAALALTESADGMFAIRGGAASLAERLADSIKQSGGTVRLNTPVLRLAYDATGQATGIDLLSGETVIASRAIVSNLTIWDTYGKLIGLNRSPVSMRKQLNSLRGWGAYMLYASLEDGTADTLPSDRFVSLTEWQHEADYDPETMQLTFAAAPRWDPRAPSGKRAVTIHAFTDVERWFTFHRDETEHEEADQRMLEEVWARLHKAMPELGSSIEVIDTATPRTSYEQTRRKLGMVGGVPVTPTSFWEREPSFKTSLPNVFVVSDTTSFPSVSGVSEAALALANNLTKPAKNL